MRDVIFIADELAIEAIRFSPVGMVGRDLARRGDTLAYRGRSTVGKRTGTLLGSIHRTPVVPTRQGLETRVGSPLRYAAPHHQGARPHIIRPRRAKALRFRIAGHIVFASRVNHPGNRPNPFLARWLQEAVR